jgi:hypothetical protein
MDKKSLSERDICTKFITPALKIAGWDEMAQIREEVSFTKGRIIVRGKLVARGKRRRVDYLLFFKPHGVGDYRLYSPLRDGPESLTGAFMSSLSRSAVKMTCRCPASKPRSSSTRVSTTCTRSAHVRQRGAFVCYHALLL